jgi:amidase
MADLHDLSALEQAAAIRRREISARDLVEHYVVRADTLDATVGAFITRTDDLARASASEIDARLATEGEVSLGSLLAGTVVPAKDLNLVAGVRFTAGSSVVDIVAPIDDNVVTRMREADLVISGKTNTPEFGLPCYTEPAVAPPARTPWDLTRSAGGSSGGAAAAVAAGIASAAQGSDGGGSIRIPASVTGLVGIKPSRGRISNGPMADGIGELGHQGVLARTVADAAALLDVLSPPFPGDPFAPHRDAHDLGTFLGATGRDPRRLRVGRFCVPVIAEVDVDPHCLAAFDAASRLIESLGHDVEGVPPPFTPIEVSAFEAVWSVGAASIPVPPDREGELRPLTRWLRERGRGVTGVELATAVGAMRGLARRTIDSTADYDVVLTPTLAALPALVGGLRDDADPAADFEAQKRFTPFTSPYNISGQPAVSVPLHWVDVAGVTLPVGVQLVGRPGGEHTLLALAAALERAAPWAHRRPSTW